jgi:NAD+ kinase
MIPWKRIAIAVKPRQSGAEPLIRRVLQMLEGRGVEVVVEGHAAEALGKRAGRPGLSRQEILEGADGVVVLGGDGTTLSVVRAIGPRAIPVLGVNLGMLGFLTAVPPDEVEEALEGVLSGDWEIRERRRLELRRPGSPDAPSELVLNDVIFTKGTALARMIELATFVDGRRVATYLSDGLIVSTPTGSTAYNLSAGGPLLDPELAAMVLTPICPHTLSHRPIVLPADRAVNVELCSPEEATLSMDGQVVEPFRPGERIQIARSAHPARFVVAPGHDHYETLRTKLSWGAR